MIHVPGNHLDHKYCVFLVNVDGLQRYGVHLKIELRDKLHFMSSCEWWKRTWVNTYICITLWDVNTDSCLRCGWVITSHWNLWIQWMPPTLSDQHRGAHPCANLGCSDHEDDIKWKHFPRNWPSVRGIHRSPVNSPHKGQWRGALMFCLIRAWINSWANNCQAGDLRRYLAHCDVIVM